MDPDSPANIQAPLPGWVAARAVAACILNTARLLVRRSMHLPRERVGVVIRFTDGTTGRVYRETTVESTHINAPCVLFVKFRLRWVRDGGHWLFRRESLLNTPLFLGFPGFVSKLWLAHDEHDVYRGIYQWDGEGRAEHYARCLWQVLALVCEPDSIAYVVVPDLQRDEVLQHPELLATVPLQNNDMWWRPTSGGWA